MMRKMQSFKNGVFLSIRSARIPVLNTPCCPGGGSRHAVGVPSPTDRASVESGLLATVRIFTCPRPWPALGKSSLPVPVSSRVKRDHSPAPGAVVSVVRWYTDGTGYKEPAPQEVLQTSVYSVTAASALCSGRGHSPTLCWGLCWGLLPSYPTRWPLRGLGHRGGMWVHCQICNI